jgi:3-hydroxyisobutyrate dehydrogenase
MSRVAFLGLGNMGGPMAANLVNAGHLVTGYDISADAMRSAASRGVAAADSAAEAVTGVDVVVSMLTKGDVVKDVLLTSGLLASMARGTLVIDTSTIDVATTRELHEAAAGLGLDFLDAPVSGGVGGAQAGTLTFMVGGSGEVFYRASGILSAMGRKLVHAGGPGAGQAIKICNQMVFAASLTAASETFVLGKRLGLDPKVLFDVMSNASGDCWALHNFCPVPGLVAGSASDNDFRPKFSARLMSKDLQLGLAAAAEIGQDLVVAPRVAQLFVELAARPQDLDTSAVIRMVPGHELITSP